MRAKNSGRFPAQIPLLQPVKNKPKLKVNKLKDLMELLKFVPPIHHQFYEDLKSLASIQAIPDQVENAEEDVNEAVDNIFDTDEDQ